MHFDWQKIVGEASRAAEKEDGIVISNQVLQTTLDGLKAISRVDLCVLDTEGIMLATTFPEAEGFRDSVLSFAESPADSQVVSGCQFFKVFDEHQLEYVLLANGNSDDVHMVGRMAAFQLACCSTYSAIKLKLLATSAVSSPPLQATRAR